MQVAVVGHPTFTTGFRLAGVDRFHEIRPEDDDVDATTAYDGAVEELLGDDDVGIVVMHQDDLDHLSRDVREAAQGSIEPTLVTLGGDGGGGQLREKIKRAIGIDLMDQ